MDEPSSPPTAPAPAPSSPEKGSGISATMAALIGTALGIVGSIATTAVSAHYTARDHADDRAEARAKDRREALTKAYVGAFVALAPYEKEAFRLQHLRDPSDKAKEIDPPPKDVDSMLRLMGSGVAVNAFHEAIAQFGVIGLEPAQSADRSSAAFQFFDSCTRFTEAARADVQGSSF